MPDVVSDTHGLIWYLENNPHLGAAARAAFEASDRGEITVYLPTVCLVEIVYLEEKGRIPSNFKARLDAILKAGTSGLVPADLTIEVVAAMSNVPRRDVPDMPDRIIAATALHLGLQLISKDKKIQLSNVSTIW